MPQSSSHTLSGLPREPPPPLYALDARLLSGLSAWRLLQFLNPTPLLDGEKYTILMPGERAIDSYHPVRGGAQRIITSSRAPSGRCAPLAPACRGIRPAAE